MKKYMPFDTVRYTGQKFRQEIIEEKKIRFGEIVATVGNRENTYVVEFGDNAYILGADSLQTYTPPREDGTEPSVHVRRKRHTEDE